MVVVQVAHVQAFCRDGGFWKAVRCHQSSHAGAEAGPASSLSSLLNSSPSLILLLPPRLNPSVPLPLFSPLLLPPYKSFHLLCTAKSVHLVSLALSNRAPNSSKARKQISRCAAVSLSMFRFAEGTVAKMRISAAEDKMRMISTLMKRKEYCSS